METDSQDQLKTPELKDDVLSLSPFTLDDVDAHVAGDDDEQARWLNQGQPSTVDSTRQWMLRNQESWRRGGPIYNFAIRTTEGQFVGMVEANTDHAAVDALEPGDANISYALYPDARGKGYATHAIRLLEGFLQQRGVARGVIRVDPENQASLSLPARLGYKDDGEITTRDGDRLRVFVTSFAS
jgi:RimJ/RimL family protein N-acetyltransferase